MPTYRLAVLSLAFFSMATLPSAAQDIIEGDAAAGAATYQTQCQSCHGVAGNSIIPMQPILAGQYAEYSASQLAAYRSGERVNAVMQQFAQQLSDEDINNLSVYLESQQAGLSGATDSELAEQGELLYRNGIPAQGVPNCTGCHGPAGKGIPPIYPRISGQHVAYTTKTMQEFRDGTRVNAVMQAIASGMTDDDMDALSEYIAGLH